MKKYIVSFVFVFFATLNAQFLVIGKDSISVEKFKKENIYALENVGINKSIEHTVDFMLWQQFAKEKKVDTLAFVKKRFSDKRNELMEDYFFPEDIIDPILNKYLKASQTESKIQVFFLEKSKDDKTDYKKIYDDVRSKKTSIADAITKYTKGNAEGMFVKTGVIDFDLELELQTLKVGEYTKLINTDQLVMFAKVEQRRPSLGYLVFGTISYPDDKEAAEKKQKIYEELKSGKKFEDVAALYGRTEDEKTKGGVIMGSPTLPDDVYEILKTKKKGEYTTEPILLGDNWFVFNIYDLAPYELNEKTKDFFKKDMLNSQYSNLIYKELISWIQTQKTYKEYPIYETIKKSHKVFDQNKNPETLLYEYLGNKFTLGQFKDYLNQEVGEKMKDISDKDWSNLVKFTNQNNILAIYTQEFFNQPNIKDELEDFRRNIYSEYVYNHWLYNEMLQHPEDLSEYYKNNMSKFVSEEEAIGRIAVISDENLKKDIIKEIKNIKKWNDLKNKYKDLVDEKNQIVVHLQEGEMPKSADVFVKHNTPFKPGVYDVKVGERDLVIAIDKIQKPRQLKEEEVKEELEHYVREKILLETLEKQRSNTKIFVEPSFVKTLEKTYKK